jgi:hypothetical protein
MKEAGDLLDSSNDKACFDVSSQSTNSVPMDTLPIKASDFGNLYSMALYNILILGL